MTQKGSCYSRQRNASRTSGEPTSAHTCDGPLTSLTCQERAKKLLLKTLKWAHGRGERGRKILLMRTDKHMYVARVHHQIMAHVSLLVTISACFCWHHHRELARTLIWVWTQCLCTIWSQDPTVHSATLLSSILMSWNVRCPRISAYLCFWVLAFSVVGLSPPCSRTFSSGMLWKWKLTVDRF